MTAPSQQYPPWLTAVVSVITDANGELTTTTNILYLPLTYYGPSIPLDPDWTYGGLTSPGPSTALPSTTQTATEPVTFTTSPAIPPPTAIPSSSTANPIPSTSTATPTSPLSSSVSLLSSSGSSLSSCSSTSTSIAPTPASNNSLTHSQLVGIIIGSVLGFLFLLLFAILLCMCRKGRRTRQGEGPLSYTFRSGLDSGFEFVEFPNEGSPRQSGGETDPFLQRNGHRPPADPEMGGRSQGANVIPRVPVPVPGVTNNSLSSSGSSTNNSGYGTLIERPTLNLLPSTREELDSSRRGRILSPEELYRLEEAEFTEKTEERPLVPPPRLIEPDAAPSSRSEPKHHSSQYSFNPYGDGDEPATVFTARRVRVDDLATRSTPWLSIRRPSMSSSGGFFGSLRRLSWFRHSDAASGRHSWPLSLPNPEDDVEAGKHLLGPPEVPESRTLAKGLGMDADRPVSTVSGQSGATVFFDALSSLPTTPVSGMGTPPAPLPRALTPSGLAAPLAWPANIAPVPHSPPAYSLNSVDDPTDIPNVNHGLPSGYDVLDMPAPPAVTHFMSIPSIPSLQHTKSATSASTSVVTYPLPPGLSFMPSKIWTDTSSVSGLPGPSGFTGLGFGANNGVPIDILEEEPPSPRESWRHLAEGVAVTKRMTFGQSPPPGQIPNIPSEDSSLYSMRAHTRSTGSAPRRDFSNSSYGTTSSPRTGHSLLHSSSISSDARRGVRARAASPTFSAFGGRVGSPPMNSVLLAAPTAAYLEPERAGAQRFGDVSGSEHSASLSSSPESRSPPGSPLLQFASAPWAAGLGEHWTAS